MACACGGPDGARARGARPDASGRRGRGRDPLSSPLSAARRELHDHNLVFRSRGGRNERESRITLCAWHHLRGVHTGRVRAEGEAPVAVMWEVGERYATE
jgi:hypothetical protein